MVEVTYEQTSDVAAKPEAAREGAPALKFDIEAYRTFVKNAGLTRAQEDELLSALWEIVVAFVDMGFDIHPVQQALPKLLDDDSSSVVPSEDNSEIVKLQFTNASAARVRKDSNEPV